MPIDLHISNILYFNTGYFYKIILCEGWNLYKMFDNEIYLVHTNKDDSLHKYYILTNIGSLDEIYSNYKHIAFCR